MENVKNSEQIRARGVEAWSRVYAMAEHERLLGNKNRFIHTLPFFSTTRARLRPRLKLCLHGEVLTHRVQV